MKYEKYNWGDVPLTPSVWPFGENAIMTTAGLREGRAFFIARAVADESYGDTAENAWAESERLDAPVLYLHFATPESARNMARDLEALAVALETYTPVEDKKE